MSFSHDRRGQSVVVGTVILFGFLILALSIYQVQFVPAENSEIEFEHSQEVEGDFLDLRNDILSAGTTGASRSTSIRLGTRYPQRTFFLNPPAASGTLQTTQERSFEIRNATVDVDDGAHENVRDFWENGAERGTYGPAFDTRSIRYTSSYNEYQGAPELVYENSLVAAEFGDRVLPRSDQTVLRDERVSLTALSGDISENGVEARSVDSETVSRGSRTIPISADGGGDLEIVLPTDTDNPSDLVDRLNVPAEVTANGDQIVISLDSTETYRLGLSEVSVDGSGSTEPAYIVPVGSEEATAGQSVGVEVRDKYNNPVEGAEVVISDGDDRTTDDDGRVFFNPGPDDSTASINGSFDPNKPGYESVEFAVSAAGGGSGGGENRTFNVAWTDDDPKQLVVGTDDTLTVQVNDQNTGEPIRDTTIDYSIAEINNPEGRIDIPLQTSEHDGEDTIDLSSNDAQVGDEFDVYASSGDDVDQIRLEVIDSEDRMSDQLSAVEGTLDEDNIPGGGRRVEFDVTADETVEIVDFSVTTQNDLSGRSFSDTGTTFAGGALPAEFSGQITIDLREFSGSGALDVGQFVDPNSQDADIVIALDFDDGSELQLGIST